MGITYLISAIHFAVAFPVFSVSVSVSLEPFGQQVWTLGAVDIEGSSDNRKERLKIIM